VKPDTAAASLFAAALAIAWLGAFTNVDLALAHAMYSDGAFSARHAWWAENLSHDIMRRVLFAVATGFIAPALADWLRPRSAWSGDFRRKLRVVALAAILVPLATSLLKHYSASHCPWDLLEFGGEQAYVRLFETAPALMPAGRCMPAGHASSALWLVSLAVFAPGRRSAVGVALAMLSCGFALGWVQQLRGAHFLTHTLWSMWIACAIAGALAYAMPYLAASHARTSPKGLSASGSLKTS
jgi:membrane-associated PAP2 superfamily phosphatase